MELAFHLAPWVASEGFAIVIVTSLSTNNSITPDIFTLSLRLQLFPIEEELWPEVILAICIFSPCPVLCFSLSPGE